MSVVPESQFWHTIAEEVAARRALVVATVVKEQGSVPRRTGAKMLLLADGSFHGSVGGGLFESLVLKDAQEALQSGASHTKTYSFNPKGANPQAFGAVCGGRAEVFLEVVMPPDRLLIVGGGHCGRALAEAASHLDFDIVIADDRAEYATVERFPFSRVSQVLHLPESYAGLPVPDENTYVVLISQGFITDEAALRRVLPVRVPYLGMIGSVRKREVVYDNLRKDGIEEEALARIHAPIGVEIGAETPEEIAISILAEVIHVRAKRRRGASLSHAP
jgi:xanthine dehydrogenase accessory factor